MERSGAQYKNNNNIIIIIIITVSVRCLKSVVFQSKLETLMVVIGGSIEEAGKLPEELACHIFSKILSAVQFMHALGFLHRDIKGQLLDC